MGSNIIDGAQWQVTHCDQWDMYKYLFWTVSWKQQFAFIHVPRCAGTSMDVHIRNSVPSAFRGVCVEPREYEQLYKFAFVRNPWDRLVSAFYQYEKNANRKFDGGFSQFVHEIVLVGNHDKMWATQPKATYDHWFPYRYFLGPLDNPHVDFIGRYENVNADWAKVAHHIGIEGHIERADKTRSRDRLKYPRYYNTKLKNIVGDFFAEDIAHFNYDF